MRLKFKEGYRSKTLKGRRMHTHYPVPENVKGSKRARDAELASLLYVTALDILSLMRVLDATRDQMAIRYHITFVAYCSQM